MMDQFDKLLTMLSMDRECISWSRRRELCQELKETLASGEACAPVRALLDFLVVDPKWEVRHAVALLMPHMEDDDLYSFAARLCKDSNGDVVRAANRAVAQRAKLTRNVRKRERTADQTFHLFQGLEARFGIARAKEVERLCEQYGGVIVGTMVHDLKSILHYLKEDMESIGNALGAGAGFQEIKPLQESVLFLERTIEDMSRFAEAPAIQRRAESVREVIEAAVRMSRANAAQHLFDPAEIKVRINAAKTLFAEVDRHRLILALANVIKNAHEAFAATERGMQQGLITIRAAEREGILVITVRDNGMGMSVDERRKLCLYTPGRRNKSKRQSTGYGLPIAVKYLAAHGGTLDIASKENRGTQVTMKFPLKVT